MVMEDVDVSVIVDVTGNSESDLSFLDNENYIPNLLTSTPLPNSKLKLNFNGTPLSSSSSTFQTALSTAFEEYITPNSSLLDNNDWFPPPAEDRIKETPMGAKVPKKRGRPPKVRPTPDIAPIELDDHDQIEPNPPSNSETHKTKTEPILEPIPEPNSPSTEQEQLDPIEPHTVEPLPPKSEDAEIPDERNIEPQPEPATTPPNLNVRTLRKRIVKKVLQPKKRGRTNTVDNDNEVVELQPEPPIPQVEVPESGLIYHDGLVWEDKPPPQVSCGTVSGILKLGLKRNHVDAALEADPENMESPLKKSRLSISFLQEPHVRFYHSPTLLKKRRPVKKLRKKKKIILPEDASEEGQIVPTASNPEVNHEEAQRLRNGIDVNDNNVKSPASQGSPPPPAINTHQVSLLGNDQAVYDNSNNAMDCIDSVTNGATSESSVVPIFGAQKNLESEKSGNFNFSFSLAMGNGIVENPNTSVSMGFEVTTELESIPEETNTLQSTSTATSLNQNGEFHPMPMEEESSAEFVNSENGNYSAEPVCPSLLDSKDPVAVIIPKLTHESMCKALQNIFESCGVNTIGDLSRKTQGDIINWPINPPRYQTVASVLLDYSITKVRTKLDTREDKSENDNTPEPILATVESIENKYSTKLRELNLTLQNLKSELKDEGPRSTDSKLSQELMSTTLSLVKSMDQGLLAKFLLKLVNRED